MDLQEQFDKMSNGLLEQGERSQTDWGTCAYRGCNGLKCAVGMIIPDEKYDASMEDNPCSHLMVYPTLLELGIDLDLAKAMQNVHDMKEPTEWGDEFEKVADQFNLDYSPEYS